MKNLFKKNLVKIISGLFITVTALVIGASCEVGLGSSVDTEAPKITITYPPTKSVIREKFVLGGKWTDDKAVKDVNVSVRKIVNGEKIEVQSVPAQVDPEGTWKIELNDSDKIKYASTNGWRFEDSTYELAAVAVDNSGHSSGETQIQVTIDNTAPVLVLTKPLSVGSSTPKTYGRTVQMEGTVSEACEAGISKLTVSFYNEAGEKLFDTEFKDVGNDISNASPLVIAQYYDEGNEPAESDENYYKWQNYKSLYGQETIDSYIQTGTSPSKKFYFTVTACDEACVYDDFENLGVKTGGNETSLYYRNTSDMDKLINGKKEHFQNFNLLKLRNYLNGTDSTYKDNESELNVILAAAESISTTTEKTETITSETSNTDTSSGNVWLSFSINPSNNPTYTMSGFEKKENDTSGNYEDGYYKYFAGSTINATISPGLDLINLKTSTISIYYKIKDSDDKLLLWTWNRNAAIEYAKTKGLTQVQAEANVDTNPSGFRYTPASADEVSDRLSINTTLSTTESDIVAGKFYDFCIEGFDNDDQQIIAANSPTGYGFVATTSTTAPVISIGSSAGNVNIEGQSAVSKDVLDSGTFGFSGTVNSSGELINEGQDYRFYTVEIKDAADSSNTDKIEGEITDCSLRNSSSYTYDWAFTVPSSAKLNAVIERGKEKGLFVLDVSVNFRNGGGTSTQKRTYYLDTKKAVISNVEISTGYSKDDVIYINNSKTFTLSGTTTDNYLVGSTSYVFAGTAANGSPKTVTGSEGGNISWSFENVDLSVFKAVSDAADIVLTVTSKDKAGNSTEKTINIELDVTPPKALHALDGKDKDVYFRIGDADNDDIDSSNPLWSNSLDKDVGGKYSGNTYANSKTVKIRGYFNDEQSDVKMIYYKIFTGTEPSVSEVNAFFNDYENLKTGFFAPLSTPKERRIFYTGIEDNEASASTAGLIGNVSDGDDDPGAQTEVKSSQKEGSKYWTKLKSNFDATISGLELGHNYIALVAVDNVGNAGLDTVTLKVKDDQGNVSYTNYTNISLNIDTESPILLCTSHNGQEYTNKVNSISVSGTCSDLPEGANSGVKSVELKVDGKAVTADVSGSSWTAEIPVSILKDLSDTTYNVNATVTDNAGNSSASTIFTLKGDTTSPWVEINTPEAASTVNGKISMSGSVEYEDSAPAKIELYCSKTVPDSSTTLESLVKLGTITDSAKIYSWKFENIDVKTKSGVTEDSPRTTLYMIPVVTDKAGNCNVYSTASDGTRTYAYRATEQAGKKPNYFAYTVDQNTDRPVIRISSMDNTEGWVTKSTVQGTVTDDDGVEEFYISQNGTTWKKQTVNSGSWSYEITGGDGEGKELFFKVKDKEGTTFVTGGSRFVRPYYLYAATEETEYGENEYGLDNTEHVVINLDTSAPYISELGLTIGEAPADLTAASVVATNPTNAEYKVSANRYIGGDYKYFKIYAPVNETNFDRVTVLIADSDGNTETKKYKTYSAGTEEAISEDELALDEVSSVTYTTGGKVYQYYETTILVSTSAVESGLKSLTITAYDKAGNKTPVTKNIQVDNDGPEVKIISPVSGEIVTGKITVSGSAIDGISGTTGTKWMIPTAAQRAEAASKASDVLRAEYLAGLTWKGTLSASSNSTMWSFVFDDESNESFDNFDSETYASDITDGIYTLPVYFKAEDSLGNYTVFESYYIKHNPDGDRPQVTFQYPSSADYDAGKTYVTLGGTIRAAGTAIIPSGTTTVKTAYVQIASDAGNFDSTDKTTASSTYGFTVADAYDAINAAAGKAYTKSAVNAMSASELEVFLKTYGFASKDDLNSWWGIAANGSAAWNIPLNQNDKMNPVSGTNDIKIRACAINAEGKMGAWTSGNDGVISIHIDNNAPSLSETVNQYSVTVNQASASVSLEPSASQTYTADMYLRGTWYLVCDTLDESGISKVEVKRLLKGAGGNPVTLDAGEYSKVTLTSGGKTGYRIFVPVTTSATYTVISIDQDTSGTPHTASMSYSFNLDNEPPTLDDLTGNELSLSETASYSANTIVNKDYVYTIGGESMDNGAGFERVVFYFLRKSDSNKTFSLGEKVLDPMISTSADDTKISLSSLEKLDIQQGSETYSLYALSRTGSSTVNTFVSNTAYDAHIRNGGLIYIDGLYRKITDITGLTVTFEPSSTETHTSVTAKFPVAQVIDNTSSEIASNRTTKPVTFKSGDDGDKMLESVTKAGSTWSWDASIQSDNLPDGPCALVILAFDKAGNVNGKKIYTMVSNNAPRLAKVYFGTDLNSNNEFEDNELELYNILGKTGEYQESFSLNFDDFGTQYGSGVFKIKDKLAVIPEITGGNNTVKLVAKKGAANVNPVKTSEGVLVSSVAGGSAAAVTSGGKTSYEASLSGEEGAAYTVTSAALSAAAEGNNFYAYVLENTVLAGKTSYTESDDGENKAFSFTFWDSTEEAVCGTDSQNAVIRIENFTLDLTDGVKPKVVINPFYWKNLTENSVYASSSAENFEDLAGHIELEKDLSSTLKTDYGTDPKVSGKITFTGTAYDDHALKSLKFTLADSEGNAYTDFDSVTMAEYNSATGKWTNTAEWKADAENTPASIADDGYEVTIVDSGEENGVYEDSTYFDQDGHKIYWILSLDTERIDTVIAKDVKLTVLAVDSSNGVTVTAETSPVVSDDYVPASSTGSRTVEDGVTNVPSYRMDVMPYITKVTTKLSSLKKNNPSVYSRTALGHYAVMSDENITLEGFNLNGNTSLDVGGIASSGEYNHTVTYDFGDTDETNDITLTALNNLNAKDAKGSFVYTKDIGATGDYSAYKNYYNRQPNGDNNNNLTDDVVLDVWEINSKAVQPKNGVITQPVMAINPSNHDVGFAFVNGTLSFSMPGEGYSYDYWIGGIDYWSSIGLAYDSLGNSYATTAGGDINASVADQFRICTSRWGTGLRDKENYNGYNYGGNQLRLEMIGQIEFEGSEAPYTPYNAYDKERAGSVSIATTAATADSTRVYMAYYDQINDEIRFKAGDFKATKALTWSTSWNAATRAATFFGDYYGKNDSSEAGGKDLTNASNQNTSSYGIYRLNHNSLIAGQTKNKITAKTGTNNTGNPVTAAVLAEDGTAVYAGKYVSIAAIAGAGTDGDDAIVAVWWDAENSQMLYSYNMTPSSIVPGTYLQTDTKWTKPKSIFKAGIGEYCKVAVDANKHVHIAAYDGLNGDVWYAFIPDFDKPAVNKTCIIDSYGIIGTELNIDVGLDLSGNSVPYISYYAGSCARPKVAFWTNITALSISSITDGADTDVFTGVWEVTTIPTESKVSIDHVNVGLWKKNGVINYSTTDGEAPDDDNVGVNSFQPGAGSETKSYGMVYGNGSKNAILGYAITKGSSGFIETAQMK